MKSQIKIGSTDRTVLVFIPDSASTDGSGKTGLTHSDLTVSFVRVETDNDVVVTDVTGSLSTLSALTDAHADWGFKEVSSTLAPGLYRLDIADAVFAAGAWSAVVYIMVTSSASAASPMEFVLTSYADEASAVWNAVTAAHAVSGSFGEQFYSIRANTAQAGGAASITLDASASAVDDYYNNTIIVITGGTGLGQSRVITDYVGSTRVATVAAWATAPDNTSTFVIIPFGAVTANVAASDIRSAVGLASANLDTQLADLPTNAELATALSDLPTNAELATALSDLPTNAELVTALSDLPTNAELVTALSDLPTNAELVTALADLPTNAELATALDPLPTAAENAAALMDLSNGIETGLTPRGALRLIASATAGKMSGGGTGTEVFRNAVQDSKARITATVDGSGNRTAITTDVA